jgi:hypothetical protein
MTLANGEMKTRAVYYVERRCIHAPIPLRVIRAPADGNK